MTTYCNAVRKLEKKFEGLELHHVPRLKNQAADELAKLGSTRRPVPSDVCLEHLHLPSVKEDPFTEEPVQPKSATDPTEVDVPAVVDLVMEILAIIHDWTVSIVAYILRQELPEDEVQARQIVHRSKSFTIIDGQLYKESVSGVFQRCISPEEGQLILEDIHSGTCENRCPTALDVDHTACPHIKGCSADPAKFTERGGLPVYLSKLITLCRSPHPPSASPEGAPARETKKLRCEGASPKARVR